MENKRKYDIRFDPQDVVRIDKMAKSLGITRAALVRLGTLKLLVELENGVPAGQAGTDSVRTPASSRTGMESSVSNDKSTR